VVKTTSCDFKEHLDMKSSRKTVQTWTLTQAHLFVGSDRAYGKVLTV
jgi:hypothetical protein